MAKWVVMHKRQRVKQLRSCDASAMRLIVFAEPVLGGETDLLHSMCR